LHSRLPMAPSNCAVGVDQTLTRFENRCDEKLGGIVVPTAHLNRYPLLDVGVVPGAVDRAPQVMYTADAIHSEAMHRRAPEHPRA